MQFDDNFPGILVDKAALDERLVEAYESWEEFSRFLQISI
jgi:hypothetical protein